MSNYLHQVASGGASQPNSTVAAPYTFTLRPAPRDDKVILVHPIGQPVEAPPLFSAQKSAAAKPDVLFYYGSQAGNQVIGDADFAKLSSKHKVSLRNVPMEMKSSDLSGDWQVIGSMFGPLTWKHSGLSGKLTGLQDAQGVRLAQIKSDGATGGKILEILVQCDGSLADLIVFTAVIARFLDKGSLETVTSVMDVVGALGSV